MKVARTSRPVARRFMRSRRSCRSTSSGTGASWGEEEGGSVSAATVTPPPLLAKSDAPRVDYRRFGPGRHIHIHHDLTTVDLQGGNDNDTPGATVDADAAAHSRPVGAIPAAGTLAERLNELRAVVCRVPHRDPRDATAVGRSQDAIAIAIPSLRRRDRLRIVLQMLEQKQSRSERAE